LGRSSVLTITAVSCILFGSAAWQLNSHSSSAQAAQPQPPAQTALPAVATPAPAAQSAQSAQAAQLHPVSATISVATKPTSSPAQPTAAPGTEIYTAKRGEAIPTVARRYLGKTSYLTSSQLADAIRAANHKSDASNILKANETIIIPGILTAPIIEKTIGVPKDFEVRAIYLTGVMAASDHGLRIIRHWREVGGNAVVFDIKDSDGSVNIPFEHPLLGQHKVYIHDVPKFVRFLHQQNMHAIARIAMFRDERMVVEHPDLAVHSRKTGQPWRENGKLVWTDPSNPQVQDYNIALAKHVAQLGADEIQFDYVRFPAEGDQKDAAFVFQKDQPADAAAQTAPVATPAANNSDVIPTAAQSAGGGTLREPISQQQSTGSQPTPKSAHHAVAHPAPTAPQRSDVITAFLKKAYAEIHPTGALLSLDVFGVMAWQRQVDLSHTGQDIVGMAHYCDVLSPMIYPSHFFGMDNIAHPGDEPAHFIGESMARFELITHPNGDLSTGVVIRPWLQAFRWRTKTYSPEYIKIQVETARAKGGIGFLFWNAANDYTKPYEAMPEMKAADQKDSKESPTGKPKFFRGDELPTATIKAALLPGQ
jgi:hypothetical protein